ncbi:alpha/beta hydrolase [Salipiger bermudensis]|uniref:alpha/beta fold hydrolase n=1 Tax=Salipiger bermudensis TaxID=344736 RepID=UPI001C99CDC2|nr:alpha/beta fold hydrolase [Salipiger bermudensis]MBY6006123.1 alpha/beta hydrolase [Salipiger bermudensis]
MTDDTGGMAQDCSWELDGLRYAGLAWGPEDGTPVLALHGWMDHADSFRALAPRLDGCRVVALDLSGQGLSAHRAPHATYNIWDDLPQIAELLDRLGWQDCVLLGHSRGANISALFAAAQPARVRALVALDSLVPEPDPDETIVTTLQAFIEQTRKQKARPPRLFASSEEYVARRAAQGNSRATSEALAGRALEPHPEGVRMRGDARLFARSAVKLKLADVEEVLRALRCPVLNVWADDGIKGRRPMVAELARRAGALVAQYEAAEVAGDHHAHLDPAAAQAIAEAMLAFLDRHGCR